jgi:hypothetical protein
LASFEEHLNQAKSNLVFLDKINVSCNVHWDWQVTTCFYVCVHLVNAHIAKTANLHYRTHKHIEESLTPFNELSITKVDEETYAAYKSLRNLSRRSRYLISDKETDSTDRACFTYDKHFRKAVIQLDNLMVYFSNKYKFSISETELQCIDFRPSDSFVFFKKK